MPLPVIVFGAIKALAAAVATWTTGEVVVVGVASAAGGVLVTAGVIYAVNRVSNNELSPSNMGPDVWSKIKLIDFKSE